MKKYQKGIAFVLAVVLCISISFTSAFASDNIENSASGFSHIDYDYVTEFSDGGKDYVYIIDGMANHALVPPDDFDPLTASDEMLDRYCFPPRPTTRNFDEYNMWVAQMSTYKGAESPNLSVKIEPVAPDDFLDYQNETRATSIKYTSNWSGYVANLGASSTSWYSQVQGDYTHPTISATSGTCVNSYWIGLGGYNSGKLVQAGTSTIGSSSHSAWYEYLSDDPTGQTVAMQVITGLTINPGDSIHLYISFEKANNKFTYYVANNTTGRGSSGYVENLSAAKQFDGTTAEWVVERCMSGTGSLYHLGNYGTCTFTNCKLTNNSSSTWLDASTQSTLYRVHMTSTGASTGTRLSTAGTMSSNNSFSCTWNAYN